MNLPPCPRHLLSIYCVPGSFLIKCLEGLCRCTRVLPLHAKPFLTSHPIQRESPVLTSRTFTVCCLLCLALLTPSSQPYWLPCFSSSAKHAPTPDPCSCYSFRLECCSSAHPHDLPSHLLCSNLSFSARCSWTKHLIPTCLRFSITFLYHLLLI